MALSYVETNGDGATTNFAVPFSYLDKTHVHVYVSSVEKTFTWVNSATIQIVPAPAVGTLNVKISRVTPRDVSLVDYNNGSVLFDTDLDAGHLQNLFIAQEFFEQATVSPPAGHTLDSHIDATPGASTVKGTFRIYDENSTMKALTISDGGLIVGESATALGASIRAKGVDGQVLEVDDAATPKLAWKQGLRKLITTAGDLLYGTGAGVGARLGLGAEGQVLTAGANAPYWQTPSSSGGSSRNNPIINGNMDVWQRGTSFSVNSAASIYVADRYRMHIGNSVGTVDVLRSTDVPTVAQCGAKLLYSLHIDVTTADIAVAAGDYAILHHAIEGGYFAPYAQKEVTLSFWVKSSKTGIHCVCVRNGGPPASSDRYLIKEYTVNVADTWERKSITFTTPSDGAQWNYETGSGLWLTWTLMAGTSVHGAADAWTAGNGPFATANQVNVLDSNANNFKITGIQLEAGPIATELTGSVFADELRRCMRYYQKSFAYGTTPAQNAGVDRAYYSLATQNGATSQHGQRFLWPVEMRAVPLLTTYNPAAANSNARNTAAAQDCIISNARDEKGLVMIFTGSAGTLIGHAIQVHWTVETEIV